MNILRKEYDTRISGNEKKYRVGYDYKIEHNGRELVIGYRETVFEDRKRKNIRMGDISINAFVELTVKHQDFSNAEEISLNQIEPMVLIEIMDFFGEDFPWEETLFDENNVIVNSENVENLIEKAISHRRYFDTCLDYKRKRFLISYVRDDVVIHECKKYGYSTMLLEFKGEYYRIVIQQDKYSFEKISNENHICEYTQRMTKIEQNYRKKCGRLAKKYGISKEVVFKCFKGEEKEIKDFKESFEKAFEKGFDQYDFVGGPKDIQDDANRLGIKATVDWFYMLPYIRKCIAAGRIISE